MKSYTKQELIDNLKQLRVKLGRNPVMKDLRTPSSYPYINTFGTWNNALKAAGMKATMKGAAKKYTKPQLKKMLRDFYKKNRRVPSKRDFEKKGYPNSSIFAGYFGSWNMALEAVGFEVKKQTKPIEKPKQTLKSPEPKSLFKRLFSRK